MTTSLASTSQVPQDLTTCDREPIRTPDSIQPHGVLLSLDARSLVVRQCSANTMDALSMPPRDVLGKSIAELLGDELAAKVAAGEPGESSPRYIATLKLPIDAHPANGHGDREQPSCHVLAHRTDQAVIVELELAAGDTSAPFDVVYPILQSMVGQVAGTSGIDAVCLEVARQVRKITGFDRVLVYQFDPGWNGIVLAEDGNGRLPSYLGQRFPASDIPAQARELYRLNLVRQIPDAGYTPVPIEPPVDPRLGEQLDLTFASLRSVSPIHVEYMQNMGTAASMSVSIVVGEKLWGLISCHNSTPTRVSFHVRTACAFLAQVLSQQLVAHTHAAEYSRRISLKTLQARLLSQMAAETNFLDGLTTDPATLLQLADASGAAVVSADRCRLVGATPSEARVKRLVRWLERRGEDEVFATHHLSKDFPEAADYAAEASGLLSVSFSKLHAHYLLWFRPELIRTLTWAGNPGKNEPDVHTGRIHPRRSFDAWKQTVHQTAEPWLAAEIEAVGELRNNVVGIVLRKAEELAEISSELERSNKELEAFSYSVSHDLRAPFRHIVGYAELVRQRESDGLTATGRRYLETIIESAHYAGTLVDNLLTFSQMGRASLAYIDVDLQQLMYEGWKDLAGDRGDRKIDFRVATLPKVKGDLMMLRLVVQNLLSNAIKYTRNAEPAVVTVGFEDAPTEHVIYVRDNGVGFDMKYVEKLFGVFQRLHRMEEFEGTGIGLANVRRIVSRHGGRTWAVGEPGEGATIYFTLPKTAAQGMENHG